MQALPLQNPEPWSSDSAWLKGHLLCCGGGAASPVIALASLLPGLLPRQVSESVPGPVASVWGWAQGTLKLHKASEADLHRSSHWALCCGRKSPAIHVYWSC